MPLVYMEYFLTTAPPPDGNLNSWMTIRAQTVKCNNLQLITDNNGIGPSISGLLGSRTLFIRYRCETAPGEPLIRMLPGAESFIYYPILTSNDITGTSSSSNGDRIQPLTDTQQHMQYLAFKVMQPNNVPIAYMNISIDFNILRVNQASLTAGDVLQFEVQLFQATLADFSDEVLLNGALQSDRFNVILTAPDPTTTISPTNKQVCRFTTVVLDGHPPPLATDTYYYRFKIARGSSTADATKILLDEITVQAFLLDGMI